MTFLSRRTILKQTAVLCATSVVRPDPYGRAIGASDSFADPLRQKAGETLLPWLPGQLDIHHISTGRGNSTLFICPDATTLMVDCGAQFAGYFGQYLDDAKPNGSLRAGQWTARYAMRQMEAAKRTEIDTFILTHFHEDHMGQYDQPGYPPLPISRFGNYKLTGLLDMAEVIPVRRIIDRNYPTYDYPVPQIMPHMKNYRLFLEALKLRGGKVERLLVGSSSQIGLERDKNRFPSFSIRNLSANGEVWTRIGDETCKFFPELSDLDPSDYPTENKCSVAIRLSYGKFDYFTGGDLDHNVRYGRWPWGDIESTVAEASGPVEVAVANHHGYVDACGPKWVRALRPQAFVIFGWNQGHPTMPGIQNMLSKDLYPSDRGVFSTATKAESRVAVAEIQQMKSENGHIIVRVAPEGDSFSVVATSSLDESDRITAFFGPFPCC